MADQVLSRTLNQEFDIVFEEVTHQESLNLLNRNDLKLFCLDIETNQFNYDPLIEFLEDNVGMYVFSRAELDGLVDAGKNWTVALKAVRRLRKAGNPGGKGTGSELGEILSYCFFEHVLEAPKILSKYEQVAAGGTYKAQSEGVHLLPVGSAKSPAYQLVYGVSGIIDDIQDAIDKAFDEIAVVSSGQRNERQVVNSTVMGKYFDADTIACLKEILIPGKTKPVDAAYGMFIGYTIGLDPKRYTNGQYRKAVLDKMILDIQNHVQYIVDKINSLNLTCSSFYVYVLPLNKALDDKKEIMDRLLGGDG